MIPKSGNRFSEKIMLKLESITRASAKAPEDGRQRPFVGHLAGSV
jgi:hypothetical protein